MLGREEVGSGTVYSVRDCQGLLSSVTGHRDAAISRALILREIIYPNALR